MWRKDSDDEPRWDDTYWSRRRRRSKSELLALLAPLIRQLERVDGLTARFRSGAACVADLGRLNDLLAQEFTLLEDGRPRKVSLVKPPELRDALHWISTDLHLEIHQYKDLLPCYLLGRVRRHWSADHLLDEMYVSPRNDFFLDACFVTLKQGGHPQVALRLSGLRARTLALLGADGGGRDPEAVCDEVLEAVGNLVFNAAWYEDQRLALRVAEVFSLGHFRSTLELVAYTLGADLHRVAADLGTAPALTARFFDEVYENAYLSRVLAHLRARNVPDLSRLEDVARAEFERLNALFGVFLGTRKAIRDLERVRRHAGVLGFYFNLPEVASPAYWTPACRRAVARVEAGAAQCAERIVQVFE